MDLLSKGKLFVKRNGPEIMAVVGAASAVGAIIFAIKGTLKVDKVLDDHKAKVETIKKVRNDEAYAEEYSEEDYKKDLTATYVKTGLGIAKVYAPTILLGASSVICTLGATNMLHKRCVALGVTATTISTAFTEYRGRVSNRFGEETEKEIYYNYTTTEVEETVVNDKGKEKKVKKKVREYGEGTSVLYSYVIDDRNKNWEIWGGSSGDDHERILWQLELFQRLANSMLVSKHMVFLNEVLEMLGIEPTQEGQCVGWVYEGAGDGYISFGIERDTQNVEEFLKGNDHIWLEFNVDGPILYNLPSASL